MLDHVIAVIVDLAKTPSLNKHEQICLGMKD